MRFRIFSGDKLRVSSCSGILFITFILPIFLSRAETAQNYIEKQIYVLESEISDIKIQHLPPWEVHSSISWYLLRPLPLDYDNTDGCKSESPCLHPIEYEKNFLQALPFNVPFQLGSQSFIESIGTFLILSKDDNGRILHRIAVRRDDSYIGYVTELIGVPFVYAPIYENGLGHQTDRGLGADCVATLIYGRRRLGEKIPYVSPKKLYEYTIRIANRNNVQDAHIRSADLLHFGFQTAVISIDNPPIGKLSDNDKVIHSYHKTVEEIEFSNLPYKKMPFEILRWK